MTKEEFATKIKAKYPEYQAVDTNTLVSKIVEKYPVYQGQISDYTVAPKSNVFTRVGDELSKRSENIAETVNTVGTDTPVLKTSLDVANQVVGAPIAAAYEALPQGVQDLGDKAGEFASKGISRLTDYISDSPRLQKFVMDNPDKAQQLEEVFGNIAAGSELVGNAAALSPIPGAVSKAAGATSRGAKQVFNTTAAATGNAVLGATDSIKSLFGSKKTRANVDNLIKEADDALSQSPALAREVAESGSQPNILQKWAGVSPDVKNRIAGKGEQLKEYFDVAHARNNLDTVPTPLEYGARKVQDTVTKMESIISDQGSKIGKFRNKIASYKAGIDDVVSIESNFNNELSKLNLEIRNGVIRKKPGTVTKVNSSSEISALNELYKDLQTVKQSPDMERLIDLRQLFDSKINFAKASRDVSSSLDPLSRSVRASIANTAKKIVGKLEAANVQKYADFMEGYSALREFTDKRTGAEFLLKQALSERGRLPREVMESIKEFTGVDLMDDAAMATIATDLIGNTRQKGLFRQEITKAGLDVEAILSGKQGAISALLDWGKKKLINEEKQFLNAAGYRDLTKVPNTNIKPTTPSTQWSENSPNSVPKSTNKMSSDNIPTTVPETTPPVKRPAKNMFSGSSPGFANIGGEMKDVTRYVDKTNPYSGAAALLDEMDRKPLYVLADAISTKGTITKQMIQDADSVIEKINESLGTRLINPDGTDLSKLKQITLLREADDALTTKAISAYDKAQARLGNKSNKKK